MDFPTTPHIPKSVQPGGGWCLGLELLWGKLRRAWLRLVRPGYVRRMSEKRQGDCPNCSHDIIDGRDLKFVRNVCGFWFRPEDNPHARPTRFGLARYGLAEVAVFSLLFCLFGGLSLWGALALHWLLWLPLAALTLAWLEILYFFRDPERAIPVDPDVMVSPADGTVTHVEETDEVDFPHGKAFRISIFLSIFNVHVNRTPWTARVAQVRYFPGAFLDARNPDSAVRNEQLWLDLVDVRGLALRVKQISGAIARRIVCWLKPGDTLERGERFGMIKLGSRTDLLLPADCVLEVLVKPGDKVRGGASVLLRLKP
ncbi:MAG: phosphatidylserine decarboxylase [Gemmataceae bacterium]|nr:phosphatidylserine decarboxylase [Gemmataceae bacterium]